MKPEHKVHIYLTGDTPAIEAVRRALLALQVEGLSFDINPPRSARKSDNFDMLTYGTITMARELQVGDQDERA